jgi:hypothetical protein
MWNVLRHQIRAYVENLKKQRDNKRAGPQIHIKRTRAEIMINQGLGKPPLVYPARVVLNDLRPVGIFLFTTAAFPLNQAVAFTMEEPKRFYVNGRIRSCQTLILDRKVISEENYQYRVGIEFEFQSKAEVESVRRYCDEIYQDIYKKAA